MIGHHLTHRRNSGGSLFSDGAHDDIAVGYHSYEPIGFSDGQRADIVGAHSLRNVTDGGVGIYDPGIAAHEFSYLHGSIPR
jgi:hypothetical protein